MAAESGSRVVERRRLQRVYEGRDAGGVDATRWSWMNPEAHWLDFTIQRFLCGSLASQGWTPQTIGRCRLLEVGCGTGQVLRWLHDAGARLLWGCEVLPWRVDQAARSTPFAHVVQADMGELPFPDGTFDCVVQVMTFSSCLDAALRRQGAREMLRVLRDDGCLLWCDFKSGSYPAGDVLGMTARDIRALFPGARLDLDSFGVRPDWLGAMTSLMNQGLVRSLARRVPACRNAAWASRRPIRTFPRLLAAALEWFPWATAYLGARIRRAPSGR